MKLVIKDRTYLDEMNQKIHELNEGIEMEREKNKRLEEGLKSMNEKFASHLNQSVLLRS